MQSIYKSSAGEGAVMAFYDAMLARWPVPYETINISTRQGNTFVIASGKETAPELLLLHGAGSNSAVWLGDIAEYSRQYRVYAVDLIGEPGKSAPTRPAWEGPAYAEWLDDVLDGLKLEKATLIGVSQGGWTAIKFATSKPERVENLVLLAPGGIVPDKLSFLLQVIPLSLLGRRGIKQINRIVLAGQTVDEEMTNGLILIMRHFKTRIGKLPLFTDAELIRLTMPVLLLMGTKDALRDGEKIASRLQTVVPQVKVTMIPDGGHALLNTTAHILPFLGM